jgi:hypothetical protein
MWVQARRDWVGSDLAMWPGNPAQSPEWFIGSPDTQKYDYDYHYGFGATIGGSDATMNMVFGGAGIDMRVGTLASFPGTGAVSVTGLGFKPDAIYFTCNDARNYGYHFTAGPITSFGACDRSLNQWGASRSAAWLSSGGKGNQWTETGIMAWGSGKIYVESMDDDGFTLNGNWTRSHVNYCAFKIDSGEVKVGHFEQPATTAPPSFVQSLTGFGFNPKAVMIGSAYLDDRWAAGGSRENTLYDGHGWAQGFASWEGLDWMDVPTWQRVYQTDMNVGGFYQEDASFRLAFIGGVSPSSTDTVGKVIHQYNALTGNIVAKAKASFPAGGIDLTWSTSTGQLGSQTGGTVGPMRYGYMAFGADELWDGSLDASVSGSGNPALPHGPGVPVGGLSFMCNHCHFQEAGNCGYFMDEANGMGEAITGNYRNVHGPSYGGGGANDWLGHLDSRSYIFKDSAVYTPLNVFQPGIIRRV